MNKKENPERRKVYYALFFPVILVLLIVLVFLFEQSMGLNFVRAGVMPREPKALINIFSMPFIHSGWGHLFNNITSFFILSAALFYFYHELAGKVLGWSLLISGLILWVIGREAWHIGLSGMVYALSFFLSISGIIRRHIPLIAIALIVIFLYGNHVWHLFPWQEFDPVSWEGHLAGAIAGMSLAFIYRKKGPQKPIKEWNDEDVDDSEEAYWRLPEEKSPQTPEGGF